MIIRKAEEKDIKKILDLLDQVLKIHREIRPDIFCEKTKYNFDDLKQILANENSPIYVAEDEDVVGYLMVQIKMSKGNNLKPRKTYYIDDLCVDENARGKHIGQTLFGFAIKDAKNRGCDDITLNVWEGNEQAQSFYKKNGFKTRSSILEYKL